MGPCANAGERKPGDKEPENAISNEGSLRDETKGRPGRPGERCPGASEPGKLGDRDTGNAWVEEIGGRGERDPGFLGDSGPGNAGDTGVDRGVSPDVAGGTGRGDDGGRPGDGVSLGDLLTRKGATTGEAVSFRLPPIPNGGGASTKPVWVSARIPNLLKSNCLASSSEIDPTDPNEPVKESGPIAEVDAKDVPDVEVDADIEVEVDTEAETIVFDGIVSDIERDTNASLCGSETPFTWSKSPCSGSSVMCLSVSPELMEYTDPFLDLVLSEPASALEETDVAVDASEYTDADPTE